MTLSEMKHILSAGDIRLAKSLGQNFLHDPNALHKIVTAAELAPDDTVLEIGAGTGVNVAHYPAAVRRLVLAEPDAAELAAIDGTAPFGPAERPMGGYLSLPPGWRDDADRAALWVEKALAHVSSLPPKVKKPKTRSA